MSWYKKYITAKSYETSITAMGLNLIVEVSGKYYPSTIIDPPEHPEAYIIGVEIDDEDEFIAEYPEYIDEFWGKVEQEFNSLKIHFGNVPQFIFISKGVKFLIKNPTGNFKDTEIIDADIVDKNELIINLPDWIHEKAQGMITD